MKKYLALIGLLLVVMLVVPSVLLASYGYYIPIIISNNSSEDLSYIPVLVVLNNSQLVELGYIEENGLDTEIVEDIANRDYLISNSYLGVFIPSIPASSSGSYSYRLGVDPPQSSFLIVLGEGSSVEVDDDGGLELGDNFTIDMKLWVDTTSGSDKNIVYKEEAFRLYVQAANTIRAAILTTGDAESLAVTATGSYMTSQMMRVEVEADGANFTITVWDESGTQLDTDTAALSGNSVPDNGNDWYFFQNDVAPCVEYIKIWA